MNLLVNMIWVSCGAVIIANTCVHSYESVQVKMNRTTSECIKNLAVAEAESVLQYLRELSVRKDPRRVSSEAPDLQSPARVTEFCDVYDHVVGQYVILEAAKTQESKRAAARAAIQWINRLFGVEPLVSTKDQQIMYNYYFQEETFFGDDKEIRTEGLALVAANIKYLVLAELRQRRRTLGGHQPATAAGLTPEATPQPLATGMHQPPKSAFTQGRIEKTIRFPCTLADLYSDQKTYSKRYAQAIQACRLRKDAAICMDSVQQFEETLGLTLDILMEQAVEEQGALTCMIIFELLPDQAKRTLKSSRWWQDLLTAKASIPIIDTYPAPQPLQWSHLVDTLIAAFYPNSERPSKYLQVWWGIQQARHEPFTAYLTKLIDLVEDVSGRAMAVWSKEDRETLLDLFSKGLWDYEVVYLVTYLPRETLLGD